VVDYDPTEQRLLCSGGLADPWLNRSGWPGSINWQSPVPPADDICGGDDHHSQFRTGARPPNSMAHPFLPGRGWQVTRTWRSPRRVHGSGAVRSNAKARWPGRLPGSATCSARMLSIWARGNERQARQQGVDIGVVGVEPVLVEGVRRGERLVEHHRPGLRLAHLAAVRGQQQWAGTAQWALFPVTAG